MRKGIITVIVAFGLLVAACSSDPTASTTSEPVPTTTPGSNGVGVGSTGTETVTGVVERFDPASIRFVAALERFDACEAVLDHFQNRISRF